MKNYLTVKLYGHYICVYTVKARNEKEAFLNAIYGNLILQTKADKFYGEGGFAIYIDEDVSIETKIEWLIEAIELGYPATEMEHMVALGLPFVVPGASNK